MRKRLYSLWTHVLSGENSIKNYVVVTLALMVVGCILQVHRAVADEQVSEVYKPYYGTNRYSLCVSASDFWQPGAPLIIVVRLTLVEKCAEPLERNAYFGVPFSDIYFELTRDDVNSSWHRFYDIGELIDYPILFREEGDFWEKTYQVYPRWGIELPRGKNVTARLEYDLSVIEFPANETDVALVPWSRRFIVHISTYGSIPEGRPLNVTLFRPFLSTFEAVTLVGFAGASGLGAIVTVYFWRKQLSLFRLFSKFSNDYPLLAHIGSSIIILILWLIFIPTLNGLFTIFRDFFFLQFLFGGVFVSLSIILTVGLLDLILSSWNFLKIGLGFLIAAIFTSFLYLVITYFLFPP